MATQNPEQLSDIPSDVLRRTKILRDAGYYLALADFSPVQPLVIPSDRDFAPKYGQSNVSTLPVSPELVAYAENVGDQAGGYVNPSATHNVQSQSAVDVVEPELNVSGVQPVLLDEGTILGNIKLIHQGMEQ